MKECNSAFKDQIIRIASLVFVILNFACGLVEQPITLEDPLLAHLDRFLREAEIRGKSIKIPSLSMGFSEAKDPFELGSCTITTPKVFKTLKKHQDWFYVFGKEWAPRVDIDKERWDFLPVILKEEVVFHELGHCLLEKPHVDELEVMNANILSASYYRANRTELLNNLFR